MRRGLLVGLWVLGFTALATAAPPKEHPAKADLIADVASVQAGQPFHVAVRITMQPHWHVYWINPGDSGQATEMKFNVPAGWQVEPLPFPTPTEFKQPGDLVGYGYEGSVLFVAKVTPPADAKGPVDLSADVEWLVCDEERCLPGKASTKLAVTVGDKPTPANEGLFRQWLDRVPTPAVDLVNVSVKEGVHELLLDLRQPAKNIKAFPAPSGDWSIENVEATAKQQTSLATLTFKSRPVSKSPKPVEMPVLIAYDDAGGSRRSVQFMYSLKP